MPETKVEPAMGVDGVTIVSTGSGFGVVLSHVAFLKGWVSFDGTPTGSYPLALTTIDSFGVSGVSKNAVGEYVISWTTPFANTGYVVSGSLRFSTNDANKGDYTVALKNTTTNPLVGSVVIDAAQGGNKVDCAFVGVMAVGRQ